MKLRKCIVFIILSVISSVCASRKLGRGWNDNINWVTLSHGLRLSQEQDLPLMLLVHKSWCQACRSLKPRFSASREIQDLSHNFVMVNTVDDEEPQDVKFAPDGSYIPRVLFFYSNGTLMPVINEGATTRYKYYYHSAEDIADSMLRSLKLVTAARVTPHEF